jgi:hypothetical protein
MNDFKLKVVLSILLAVAFSFIFILLAFALPLEQKKPTIINNHKGKLEKISDSLKN